MKAIKVRRSSLSFVIHAVLLSTLTYRWFFSDIEQTQAAGIVIKFIIIPLLAVVVLRMFLYPNYLVANGEAITIYRDHLIDEKIAIENIDHVELCATPFRKSYFVLKTNTRIAFSYFDLESKSSINFFDKLGKPLKDV